MTKPLSQEDFEIRRLGDTGITSPLRLGSTPGDDVADFVPDETRVLYRVASENLADFDSNFFLERAGPREKLFFDPSRTRAAVVTCGGLCPGINNVIRSLFLELHHAYRVPEVWGFKYGYRGMNPAHGNEPVRLTPEFVRSIHNAGGSVLGTSRGEEDSDVLVDRLVDMGIDMFFCVGGDGTLRGAHSIYKEIQRRGLDIAVVGVPKTIDNDIPLVYKTFGFDTAVGVVREALYGAHTEAVAMPNGIGIVKVMGRDSGFITAYGTLASGEVNYCLIPEVSFTLDGDGGLLDLLEQRLRNRGHAVIAVAEGAGQEFFEGRADEFDASGNKRQHNIGTLLRDEISRYFGLSGMSINTKYIDPSYLIRSVKANASDAIFCNNLARNAVHAAMAGKTDVVIGLWHGLYVHVPNTTVTRQERKNINPESYLWRSVLQATGQPQRIGPRREA